MEFHYTEAQQATRRLVREFTEREVLPGEYERFREGRFDYQLYRRLGELGISSMHFPPEWEGAGSDFLSWCLALEELSRGDSSMAVSLMVATLGAKQILEQGTGEQKERWRDEYILPVIRAEATSSAAITEPGAGSDTAGIQTRAELRGDEWVINGQKAYITNAVLENNAFVIVLCRTSKEKREFSSILVPINTPGLTRRPLRTMGGFDGLGEFFFDDCRVPAFNLVGERGGGRGYIVRKEFAVARICVASISLGIAEAAFEEALRYAQQRLAFGQPISKFQFVQSMLVDMALEKELSRLLRDKAACSIDEGNLDLKLSSMAKYFCCESAKRATDYAVQVHGALGFMDETRVSRLYRAVRAYTIADGTTEIQKFIIARELGC